LPGQTYRHSHLPVILDPGEFLVYVRPKNFSARGDRERNMFARALCKRFEFEKGCMGMTHQPFCNQAVCLRSSSMRRPFSVGQPAFGRQGVAHCLIRTVVSALPNGSSIKCSQGGCSQFPVQFGPRFGIK
jgi:hypothetical protein